MRLIDADELYRKILGYKDGVVDKSVAKRLIEQMPTIDAVNRQAAIDLVTDMEFMNNTAKGILRDRLRKLPSAQPEIMYYPQVDGITPSVIIQPERKKGKWDTTLRDDPLIKTSDCICSICGGRTFGTPNFCPNCGADMRGNNK